MVRKNGFQKTVIITLAGLLFLNSCSKEDERIEQEKIKLKEYLERNGYESLEPTTSGLYYAVLKPGVGKNPVSSDYVNIHFTSSLVDGTVFETSYANIAFIHNIIRNDKLYGPTKFHLADFGIPGLKEGILLMNEGGISRIIIPSHLGFGPESFGIVPPYSTLIYDIELLNVISDPVEHEQKLIDKYLENNDITVTPTNSGLYYIEKQQGAGDLPGDYSNIVYHYKAYLIDGRLFSRSDPQIPDTINLVLDSPIAGLAEGLKMMRSGGEAKLIVPWFLGFGEEGSVDQIIPPYSTLIYDLEVLSVQ